MPRYLFLLVIIFAACQDARPQQDQKVVKSIVKTSAMDTTGKVYKSEEEWKKILTPEQYHVLREKGTDAPFTGKLTLNTEKGSYSCAACGNELFSSDMKFE
jgi:peptide-methionine (R)-S-oxide reductase